MFVDCNVNVKLFSKVKMEFGCECGCLGADGLVKLWTIKSSECVNTFDHHDDKVLLKFGPI
jgi:WD40 repeat protein